MSPQALTFSILSEAPGMPGLPSTGQGREALRGAFSRSSGHPVSEDDMQSVPVCSFPPDQFVSVQLRKYLRFIISYPNILKPPQMVHHFIKLPFLLRSKLDRIQKGKQSEAIASIGLAGEAYGFPKGNSLLQRGKRDEDENSGNHNRLCRASSLCLVMQNLG